MCAITASFTKKKLLELYKLNAYRGERSHSLTTFDHDNDNRVRLGVLFQEEGPLDEVTLNAMHDIPERYFVAHSQAPTQQTNNIHPASYEHALLWHNGIVKQKSIPEGIWDTQWMLENICNYGWSFLSRVDGTFACIMYKDSNLYIFRNEISPLFIDSNYNISSTKFEGSKSLPPNMVYKLDIKDKRMTIEAAFETMENPYYIPEYQ